jgi:hypothetical protein
MILRLNEENYHSLEANRVYMGSTQFKNFWQCTAGALARVQGAWQDEDKECYLAGNYFDAHFSGTMEQFLEAHPEVYSKKTGKLYEEYEKANRAIERAERDAVWMEYVSGQHQVIMTGRIAGVRFKIKVDSLHPDKIVDMKYMKDFNPVWTDEGKMPFVEAYGYDIQASIYQEIVRQKTKKRLPVILACATKEKNTDIDLFRIPQGRLDYCLDIVKRHAPEYSEVKLGIQEPFRCGKCEYCKATKVLKGPINYDLA